MHTMKVLSISAYGEAVGPLMRKGAVVALGVRLCRRPPILWDLGCRNGPVELLIFAIFLKVYFSFPSGILHMVSQTASGGPWRRSLGGKGSLLTALCG